MGKRIWLAIALASCVGSAFAAGPGAVRKQVESSLLVTGTIDINPDGSVAGHALQGRETLPDGLVAMIERAVPQWRFEPVALSGGATRARATMNLRIVAKKTDSDDYAVQIRGAQFGDDRPGEFVAARDLLAAPRYPEQAARAGVGGTVYTVLKVGRDGRVEEAIAEQVNLRVVADENSMRRWRALLGSAALHAARKWTFLPPSKGAAIDAPYWSARVPVDFVAPGTRQPDDHQWHAYVPGPRAAIPWRDDEAGSGADALATGGVYPLDGGPRLLTALDPS